MLYLNSVRMAPGVRSAMAMACGLALSSMQAARAAEDVVEPVVVTASRMPQLLQTAPIGATVITAEQMARAGVADANEAIRKLAGVAAKSDLNNGRENTLDLRGYGDTAGQNLVVLLNGIRVSENELASARLTSIPLELIDRIEIVRGGASVLWGEGASAGVINVILKTPQGDVRSARVSAGIESFGGQELSASGQWGFGKTVVDASAKRVRSDGFRDNAAYKQDVAALGLSWADMGWQAGLRVTQETEDAELPGSMALTDLRTRPRYASTPLDFSRVTETRYLANVSYTQGPWSGQLDLGRRDRQVAYQYLSFGSKVDTGSAQSQLTPRLVYASDVAGAAVKAIVGLDWLGWDFDAQGFFGPETGAQENKAGFAQFELALPTRTRLSVGWREEHVRKSGEVSAVGLNYDRRDKLHAGEFGVNQSLAPGWDVYGRLASSYRLANVDENRTTPSNGPLLPQRNSDRELGLKWAHGNHALTARYFVQNTVDEINYVGAPVYANVNLDPTRRRGAELEGRWTPISALTVTATWQQLTARFRAGVNEGKEMPLVAPHTGTARASYRVDERNTVDVGMQYLAPMRYGDDGANQCDSRIPSSALLDARYAWSDRVWTLALAGTNLADKKGYNYGYGCHASSIYPYAGRSMKVTVSRQF